ncbi:hypothetical protein Tco_1001797 [Tanacetum coccineum]
MAIDRLHELVYFSYVLHLMKILGLLYATTFWNNSLEDTTGLGSFPPLPTQVNTSAGTLSKSSYANAAGKPSGKKLNIHTLFTPGGNGIDVVVPVESIRAVSERFANSAYGFFLGKKVAYPVVANYVRSSYARVMIKLRADVELKDNIVMFGTNGRTSNLGNNNATPSGSSFMNINNDGEFASNTPIVEKIDKIEQQISKGKLRDSYSNNDDYDPNDDDMYENQDLSEHLQFICDNLDITVCGKKKK